MGRWPPFLSHAASLPLVVVLPEPCRPAMRITVGGCEAELEAGGIAAEQFDQLVADDLDDLLGGRKSGKHFSANGFGADMFDELVDDVEINVRFEHGDADLFERFLDVLFSKRALARGGS